MKKALVVLWLIVLIVGLLGVIERISGGLRPTALGSYVTWGLWIAADIYFIGLSAGAFLISSLVYVFRIRKLERVGPLALFTALVTLLLALASAWFDIGHMARFYKVFTTPSPRSMMAWMIWLYTLYSLLLTAELWLALRPRLLAWSKLTDVRGYVGRALLLGRTEVGPETLAQNRRVLRVLGSIGIPLAIAFHGGMGALFATLIARPYWYGPLYPIYFLTGALVSGTAFLIALTAVMWRRWDGPLHEAVFFLGRVLLGLMLFDLLLEWAELTIPSWYGVGPEIDLFKVVLFGEYWWVFWIVHLLLGVAIPLYYLVRHPRSLAAVGIAGWLVAICFMAVRLDIVIPGFVMPELRGLNRAFFDPRLTYSYFPSAMEWQVFAFVVAVGVALFVLGWRLLPLTEEAGAS